MAYHYRLASQISEADFFTQDEEDDIDFSKIDNIVLLDDVIGTGQSVATDIAHVIEEIHSLSRSRNVYVLTVAGYVEGISRVVEETGASVISALEYSVKTLSPILIARFTRDFPCLNVPELWIASSATVELLRTLT